MTVLKHLKHSDDVSKLKMQNVKMNIALLPEILFIYTLGYTYYFMIKKWKPEYFCINEYKINKYVEMIQLYIPTMEPLNVAGLTTLLEGQLEMLRWLM